jgi:hypothetical protein
MSNPLPDGLAERIERLERQCCRWRWVGTATALALAVALTAVAAWRIQPPTEIRAGSLWIVGERGQALIRLGSSNREKDSGLIEFLDESGRPRMVMALANTQAPPSDKGNGLIELLDGSGRPCLLMGVAMSHTPFLKLLGGEGRDELALDAGGERSAGITLKDLKRDSGIMLAKTPEGIAGLGFMSPGGKLVLEMGAKADGVARLLIRDVEGKELVRLPDR